MSDFEAIDEYLARRTARDIRGTGMELVLRRLGEGPATREDFARLQARVGTTSHPLINYGMRLHLAGLAAGGLTLGITANGQAVLDQLKLMDKEESTPNGGA